MNSSKLNDQVKNANNMGHVFAVIAHESQFYTLYPLPLCHLAAAFDSEQEALEKLVTDRQTHVYGYKWTLSNPIHYAQVLWGMLGDVAVDEDDCIESTFLNFDVGTDRTEIWHWFEETFDVSVAEDLMRMKG
jgi:hypothetical protein